jgi:transcriptional regulator with XRE-family HTH domain
MEHLLCRNAVGSQIRRLRSQRGWTQEVLAAKCQVAGCALTRGTLAKIEAGIRPATDIELFILAWVLNVRTDELFAPGLKKTLKERGWSRAVKAAVR